MNRFSQGGPLVAGVLELHQRAHAGRQLPHLLHSNGRLLLAGRLRRGADRYAAGGPALGGLRAAGVALQPGLQLARRLGGHRQCCLEHLLKSQKKRGGF